MRYIDDTFFIQTESEDKLEDFLQHLNLKSLLIFYMLQSVLTVRSSKLIFIVDPLIVISFLSLTQRILSRTEKSIVYSQGVPIKRLRSKKDTLKNTLKVYVVGLTSAVNPRNLLTIKLGEFLKAKQSIYLNVAQRLRLVYHLL